MYCISGNILREKTFASCAVLCLFAKKSSLQSGGKGTRIYVLNARYDRELHVKNAIKLRVFTPS